MDRILNDYVAGETLGIVYCFDCDTSMNGEGFLELYRNTHYDKEPNDWEYVGILDCSEYVLDEAEDDVLQNELYDAIDKLLLNSK